MKTILWLVILTAVFVCVSYGEETDDAISFSEMEKQLENAGSEMDLQAMFEAIVSKDASITPDEMLARLKEALLSRIGLAARFLKKAALLILISAFVSRFIQSARTGRFACFTIHLISALTLYYEMITFLQNTERSLSAISGLIESATPILVGILALTGETHVSAFITPMGAFVSGAIGMGLQKIGIMLIKLYAALTLAGSIGEMPVKRLSEGISSLFKWLIGSAVSLFLLFMATGGAIAGAYDGAFFKGLKYAADTLIPIVGSEIAGKMDSITAGAALLKSAAGVTGMMALFNVCLYPALDAFINLWGLRFLSCLLESVSDGDGVSVAESFSKVFALMFALIAAAASMGLLYLSAVVGVGRRVLG